MLPATLPELQLPVQLLIHKQTPQQAQDEILVVQQEASGLRWSLLDPLGMPIARQLLRDGKWSNDGLLPPNGDAHALFAALLFAWTPADRLAANYPASDWRLESPRERSLWRNGQQQWRVSYADAGLQRFALVNAAGASWQIGPMPGTGP
jgi:hypothetical protein